MSMNYHYFDLLDELHLRVRQSFSFFLDSEDDGIPGHYVEFSHALILKGAKSYTKRLIKEDKKYQRRLKREEREKRRKNKHDRGQEAVPPNGADNSAPSKALQECVVNEKAPEISL